MHQGQVPNSPAAATVYRPAYSKNTDKEGIVSAPTFLRETAI